MNKDNTEGTSKPEDTVQTTREALPSKEKLQQDYDAAGSIKKLAEMYGIGGKRAGNMLKNAGVQIKPRGHAKGSKKSEAWREASAKHWNDPAWVEQQRQKWLGRLPKMRKGKGVSPGEKLLHDALIKAQVSFEANAVMLEGKYVVDILITQKPLILEADGSSHYLDRAQEADAQRTEDLREAGYEIRRFKYEELSANADICVDSLNLETESNPEFSIRSDAQAFGERINKLRDDPEWKERWLANLRKAQQTRRERERNTADDDIVGPA
jgi:very-short-patch-repair endonuclease